MACVRNPALCERAARCETRALYCLLNQRIEDTLQSVTLADLMDADWLAVHGYDPQFGARFLRRVIERHVTTALAETPVHHNPGAGSRVTLTASAKAVVANVDEPADAAEKKEVLTLPVGTVTEARPADRKTVQAEATSQ